MLFSHVNIEIVAQNYLEELVAKVVTVLETK